MYIPHSFAFYYFYVCKNINFEFFYKNKFMLCVKNHQNNINLQSFYLIDFISDIFKEGTRDQWTSTALHKGSLYNNIKKIQVQI